MIQKIVMRRKELFICASEQLKYTMIFSGINFFKTVEQIHENMTLVNANINNIENQVTQDIVNVKLSLKDQSKNEFFIDLNFGQLSKFSWLKNNRAMQKNLSMVNLTKNQFEILMNNIDTEQVSFQKELCSK